eukprot:scpid15815/ scgid3227/ VWFA and cache domain-containing protein 1
MMDTVWVAWAVSANALLVTLALISLPTGSNGQFCSVFNNRSPTPQPGLRNCSWYRDSSCCRNEEIDSLFDTVVLPDQANRRCRNLITYLMCYVCDPAQSNFYQQERLTVCDRFCDDVLEACADAVFGGSRLETRFGSDGARFCRELRFEVGTSAETCFNLAEDRRTLPLSSGESVRPASTLLYALAAFVLTTFRHMRPTSVALLVVLIASSTLVKPSSGAVTADNIRDMAAALENELITIARDGIKRDRVQDIYEMADRRRNALNATSILGNIESQLESLLNDLDSAASQLSSSIATARSNYLLSPVQPLPLANLSSDVYVDADSISALSALNLSYNSTFRRPVSFEQSVVKIPAEVTRSSREVQEAVQWTAAIDSVLAELQSKRNVRWTYFGSETGIYRIYPASEWPSTFAGFKRDFDPRSRPWYLSATSGPKAVGIFLDCSASMEDDQRWDIAVRTVRQIVNTLTRDDQVNIVCSRGSYYNSAGRYITANSVTLGCNKQSMMRATTSNRAQLLDALDGQSPFGSGAQHESSLNDVVGMFPDVTTGCMNVLVFVTDGKDIDDDHYADRCTDHDQQGGSSTRGCNIIRLDLAGMWSIADRAHITRSARVVAIETGDEGSELPGMMACSNDGVYVQMLSTRNVRFQLSPYYSYLSRLGNPATDSRQTTSPYIDVNGLGRLITLSVPIYDRVGERNLLGVFGVDAVLDDLENTLLDDQFGLSYGFLIDTEGRALVHPRLTPSAELVTDPVYPSIQELEQNSQGEPSAFSMTLVEMMRQQRGSSSLITGPRPQQRGSISDGVVFREEVRFTYHYSAIPSSQFAFAFVLTEEDTDQDTLIDITYNQSQPINYYHEIGRYGSAARNTLGFSTNVFGYGTANNPLAIAQDESTFKLAARAFCDPTRYLLSDFPTFDSVVSFFNSNESYVSCENGGLYLQDIRPTVWASQAIQDFWKNNRTARTMDEVAWTYFGSANGMWRSFPGSQSRRSYDPSRRPWYHRALANPPSVYATSAVYLDAGGVGKVVTLAQTIFHGRPAAAMAGPCTTVENYAGGCACTEHTQCTSQYCDRGTCTNQAIAGVAAVDLRYTQFEALVSATLGSVPTVNNDPCANSDNRCILVNDAAEVVYDQTISNVSDLDPRNFENVPLAFLHGGVMLSLIDEGIFTRFSFVNRQGLCQVARYAPSVSDRDLLLTAEQQDNYFENRGPIPRFQNNFGCELDQILYQRNVSSPIPTDFSRTFEGPCEDGVYRIAPVANTNLLLVVIERTQVKRDNFFNFNCHIFNNVARSGGFRLEETACSSTDDSAIVPRMCLQFSGFVPSCTFNTATTIALSLAILPLCFAASAIVWLV